MKFRFDMQGKTPQQRMIVAKKDLENTRRQQEVFDIHEEKISEDVKKSIRILAIDKDTCPIKDNIIMKQQCSDCQNYKDFMIYNGQPCIKCSCKQ